MRASILGIAWLLRLIIVACSPEQATPSPEPITVLTAGKFTVLNPGLPPDVEADLAQLFHDLQSRLAELSSTGRQVLVPERGHNMPRQNPQAVVDAIRNMVLERLGWSWRSCLIADVTSGAAQGMAAARACGRVLNYIGI